MKKSYFFILAFFVINIGNSQVVFSEDFNNGIPATWTLTDVDGNTPDPNVAQFTNAWIGAADFDNTTDTVAMSTSWYSPPGTADDWIASPVINLTANNILTWEEEGQDANFPDGYEVYLSTSGATPADFLGANGTMIFNIAGSSPAVWVTRTVDLQALGFANQAIYLAWRNNATDQFVLMIDDITINEIIAFDAAISNPIVPEYTLIPMAQATPLGTDGAIDNLGGSTVTNVTMKVNVYDGTMTNVYTATSAPVASMASGSNTTFNVAGYTPTLADLYTVELIANIAETDGAPSNDTVTYTVGITDSTYARDNGTVTGSLGIGTGLTGELGQNFVLNVNDTITSVDAFIVNGTGTMTGQPFSCNIYDVTNGTIGSLLGTTDTITIDTSTNRLWNLPISGNFLSLNGVDTFAVIAQEGDSNITLGTTTDIFTPNTTWVLLGSGSWASNESFGFNVSYVLRANFGTVPATCSATSSIITASNCDSYTAPSGAIFTSSGTVMDTILNTAGCDSVITINLTVNSTTNSTITEVACNSYTAPSGAIFTSSGTVTDIITNASGCDSVITINLTIDVVNDMVTASGDTLTADMAGASYQWIDCDNGATTITGATNQYYIATVSGNYAVVITSGNCTDTSACTNVIITSIADRINPLENTTIFPNPTNGNFTITFNGVSTQSLNFQIVDVTGKVVLEQIIKNVTNQLQLPIDLDLESGTYFINLNADGLSETKQIVIFKK